MATVLATLDALEATELERFDTVLCAYAESDFDPGAEQVMQGGASTTVGVFQQDPRYWPSALEGTEAQCRAFVRDYRDQAAKHTDDSVQRCWVTQRWSLPGSDWPDVGPLFESEKARMRSETWNYARRVPDVAGIIARRALPTSG